MAARQERRWQWVQAGGRTRVASSAIPRLGLVAVELTLCFRRKGERVLPFVLSRHG